MNLISELVARHFHRLACLAIVIVGLIVYSNTIHSSFQFDDYKSIVDNPAIRDPQNIPQLFRGEGPTAPSRAIVTTTFAINYYLGGDSVEGYRWFNISIHLLNGLLVYLLAVTILSKYFSGARGMDTSIARVLALFVALLFVASPIQTHAVAYIVQRNGLIASFFYLLSLVLFTKAVTSHGVSAYLYTGSVLSFLFAIWCKEMAYSAPVIMFLYYQCFVAGHCRSPGKGLRLVLPYVALAAVSFYLTVPLGAERSAPEWGRWEYLLTQSNALIEYIKLLVLPLPGRLNVDYDFPLAGTLWEFPTLLSAVSIVAILATAFLFLDRARLLAFSVLWFFVTLAPTSSFIPLRDLMVTYRLYLPGVGFYLLLVVGVHKAVCYLGERRGLEPRFTRLAELAVLISIVLFYSACTYERNNVWKTQITLWEDTVNKSPNKVRPHYNLGYCYAKEGQEIKAWKQYLICKGLHIKAPRIRDSLELECYSAACNNLGMIYFNAGLYNVAVPILKEAIKINPNSAKAHSNLGDAYVYTGRMEEAEAEYKLDIQLNNKRSRAYGGLGLVYESKGMLDEAIGAYTNAVRVDPTNTAVWMKLGRLWLNHRKDAHKAMHYLREAQRVCTDQETLEEINKLVGVIQGQRLSQHLPDVRRTP